MMEENTNMTDQATQAGNVGNGADAQGADQAADRPGKEPKLFTQEEVNGFVQSRVNRLRGQIEKDSKVEYEQKLAELQAREMKLTVKERLSDRGMPKELADIITCADEKDIDSKLDALQKIYGNKAKEKEEKSTGFVKVGVAGTTGVMYNPDPVRKAMGLE